MNYYDEDEYSSAASFRARSNTWPLNRPDLATPNGVSIDETLPEIDLEEDDLFTTNDNWNSALVDHDIMSWDPILNAQRYNNHQQQQQQHQSSATAAAANSHNQFHNDNGTTSATSASATTSAPAPTVPTAATATTTQYPQQQQHYHNATTTAPTTTSTTPNQASNNNNDNPSHVQNQQPPQPHLQQQIHLHSNNKLTPQAQQPQIHQQPQHHHMQHHHQQQQQQQICNGGLSSSNNTHIYTTSHQLNDDRIQNNQQHEMNQPLNSHIQPQSQQLSPSQLNHHQPQHHHHQQQPHQQQHHQPPPPPSLPLNSSHCLDPEDHIQQMHHLSLDGNHGSNDQGHQHHLQQSSHYIPTISSSSSPSMCVYGASNPIEIESYNISPNHPHHHHQHHNLQQLSAANYDIDHQSELDLKSSHEHQLHHMTSSSQDPNSSTHQLSSSLSTSGIGLSCDLDDQDYKVIDPSLVLQNSSFNDRLLDSQCGLNQQINDPSGTADGISSKPQSSSASSSSSKTKLNAPRRNAWGNMSYADLITQAINSTNDKRLTLSEIYDWMVQQVPYFKDKGDSTSSAGWKNSVRHNLSLHSRFKRLQNEGTGKSSWWTINPEANIGKCARRRAASMEASKFEKKRGRAKKKAEAVRQGLVSYPSLTSSSLNGSASNLNQSRLDLTAEQYPPQNQNQDQQNEIESGGELHLLLAPTSYCCSFTQQQSANQISGSPAFRLSS